MSEWIRVEDRFPEPEPNGCFVIAFDGSNVYQCIFHDGMFWDYWGRYEEVEQPRITHWMPLPDPPITDERSQ